LSVECNPNDFDGTIAIKENDVKMCVNALEGQKTGYFMTKEKIGGYLLNFHTINMSLMPFAILGRTAYMP